MLAFYPKEFPELEVYYNVIPGQAGSFEDPEYAPEIEWEDIEIFGRPVSVELHHHFISILGTKWEREILNTLASRRRTAA